MALNITPEQIVHYTQCPKFYSFTSNLPKIAPKHSLNFNIIRKVIQTAYLYTLRREREPEWRYISRWCDRFFAEQITPLDDLDRAYKDGKHLLKTLHQWFYKKHKVGYLSHINVPIAINLEYRVKYLDSIDIIHTKGNQVILSDFIEAPSYSQAQLRRDMKVYVKSWGFWRNTEIRPTSYIRYVVQHESVQLYEIKIKPEILDRTNEMTRYVLQGILDRVYYPSWNEQCLTCPFLKRCGI